MLLISRGIPLLQDGGGEGKVYIEENFENRCPRALYKKDQTDDLAKGSLCYFRRCAYYHC